MDTSKKIRSASPKKAKTAGAVKRKKAVKHASRGGAGLCWKCHTPNLLNELLCNSGVAILEKPLQIFGLLLHAVAARASEINDPELNLLMLRLALYEAGDPIIHSWDEIAETMADQLSRLPAHRRVEIATGA